MENSCWTDSSSSSQFFFLWGKREEKKLQDENDVIEGVGLLSLTLAGSLADSMKNEE